MAGTTTTTTTTTTNHYESCRQFWDQFHDFRAVRRLSLAIMTEINNRFGEENLEHGLKQLPPELPAVVSEFHTPSDWFVSRLQRWSADARSCLESLKGLQSRTFVDVLDTTIEFWGQYLDKQTPLKGVMKCYFPNIKGQDLLRLRVLAEPLSWILGLDDKGTMHTAVLFLMIAVEADARAPAENDEAFRTAQLLTWLDRFLRDIYGLE